MTHVLIGAPTYDTTRYNAIPLARALRHPPKDTLVNLVEQSGSLLAYTFNSLWCMALQLRAAPANVTHFLLIHADIMPDNDNWLDIMLEEMKEHKAQILSAVVPIKGESGMTSTAWDNDPWNPYRLSLTELQEKPKTWTEPNLLINTGLLLVDFTQPWVEQIRFHINDMIVKDENGVFHAVVAPEDWNFSRDARNLGVESYATKAVTIRHMGLAAYSNANVWGYPNDAVYRAFQMEANRPVEMPPAPTRE